MHLNNPGIIIQYGLLDDISKGTHYLTLSISTGVWKKCFIISSVLSESLMIKLYLKYFALQMLFMPFCLLVWVGILRGK